MYEKIKVTYSLPARIIKQIDRRSAHLNAKKSEILESDLGTFWALMQEGQKAILKLSEAEQAALLELFRAKRIRGEELLVWASSGLLATVKAHLGKGSVWRKLRKMTLLERVALLDWLGLH